VATLSRDTDNANGSIAPIFDKEKEQNRLKQSQLIGEIASQATDIALTHGDIVATKAAREKMKAITPAQQEAAKQDWLKANPGKVPTDKQLNEQVYNNFYNQALTDSGFGTGGNVQRAIQAATAAMQGLAGGNIAQALSGASAPYLAGVIKQSTGDNKTANAMAHAVLGAITAQLSNQSALAGGLGAGGAELAAQEITKQMFPGKDAKDLTEREKQQVSALSQLAASLAGGITTGDTAGAITAAQTGKNAVENNYLSVTQLDNFAQKARTCEGAACQQVIKEMVDTNLKQQKEMLDFCSSQPSQCADKYGYLVDQWDVFDQTIKRLDVDGKLPNEFKNYLSAVYSSSMEAEGTVANLGWQQKFEALGLDKDTAVAMASVVPGLIAAKGPKGSAIPVPQAVKANNGLIYQSNSKHTPGQLGNRSNAGIEPQDSLRLFDNSISSSKKYPNKEVRFSVDDKGNIHRFEGTNGVYHWNGSSGDVRNKLTAKQIPSDIQKKLGVVIK